MKNFTSHDAIRIIKYQGFFKKLKYFNITFKVYPLDDSDKIGHYYVVIKDQEQFIDTIYLVNVLKKNFTEEDFETSLNKIRELKLSEFIVEVNRKKENQHGQY